MSNLFSLSDIKNHPSRSGFDLSKHMPFTAKAGELLPVCSHFVYPKEKYRLSHRHFTRTQPVNTAAFLRTREYFDWYFVPLRLLNKNLPSAIVQMSKNPTSATDPLTNKSLTYDFPHTQLFYTTGNLSIENAVEFMYGYTAGSETYPRILNAFGFGAAQGAVKLLSYLDFGNFKQGTKLGGKNYGVSSDPNFSLLASLACNKNVNLIELFAYQKIYADHYRFSQWEQNEAYTYNFDYYAGGNFMNLYDTYAKKKKFAANHNFLTLRYANWPKDLFMGLMPDQQLGEVSTISLGSDGSSFSPLKGLFFDDRGNVNIQDLKGAPTGQRPGSPVDLVTTKELPEATGASPLGVSLDAFVTSFNVIQLRTAQALQKWKEVSLVADQTYLGQVEAHLGVKLSSALADVSMYIGGSASNLSINEVENNNLVDGQATLAGKGVGSGSSSETFVAPDYGILMCLYHVQPILDYTVTGQSWFKQIINTQDLPIPEFDRIGLESVRITQLFNEPGVTPAFGNFVMGYAPRFYGLKTDIDHVQGAFRSTLKNWVVSLDLSRLSRWFGSSVTSTSSGSHLNYSFFKVNPAMLDTVFSVAVDDTWDTDQFLVNAYFDIKAVRPFDYDGMPY